MHKLNNPDNGSSKRDFLKACAASACTLCLASLLWTKTAGAQTAQRGLIKRKRSPWFTPLENASIRCEICPRKCLIAPGARGHCRVRENRAGECYSLVYGNPCVVQLDPVERKPFFHVLPGTQSLSVATVGCNIECKFCESWDIALVAPEDVYAYDLPPEAVIEQARATKARSVSYAFSEPVVFYEYMEAISTLAKRAKLLNLVHTNGFIAQKPLEALCGRLDAVNVDLKGFDPAFYRDLCEGELTPVLETLKQLKAADVHIEITNLVIPTLNDDMARIREMCHWIKSELGPGVPLHFARFYPLYKLANLPPTPVSTLDRAREVAFKAGLDYVYVARVTGHEGENTFCPGCRKAVIRRMGFVIGETHLKSGKCGHCGAPIPGRWS